MTGVTTNFIDLFKEDIFLLGDFSDFFLGNCIGTGCSRSVYEYRIDPKYVVKIDRTNLFNNVTEWDIYHNLKDSPLGKWLAPCIALSSCGRVMLQRKTIPIKFAKLPVMVPSYFADTKLQNWGRIGNNIVCHDYANHAFFSGGNKMVKAKWRDDNIGLV